MSRAFIFRASLASASKTSCSLPTTGRSYSPDRRLQSNNRSDDQQTHGENLCTANPIILRLIGRVCSRDANHLRLHVTLEAQHRVFPAKCRTLWRRRTGSADLEERRVDSPRRFLPPDVRRFQILSLDHWSRQNR